MKRQKFQFKNTLQIWYTDGSTDKVTDNSKEIWTRFKAIAKYFLDEKYCGMREIQILDNREKPIMSVKLYV